MALAVSCRFMRHTRFCVTRVPDPCPCTLPSPLLIPTRPRSPNTSELSSLTKRARFFSFRTRLAVLPPQPPTAALLTSSAQAPARHRSLLLPHLSTSSAQAPARHHSLSIRARCTHLPPGYLSRQGLNLAPRRIITTSSAAP